MHAYQLSDAKILSLCHATHVYGPFLSTQSLMLIRVADEKTNSAARPRSCIACLKIAFTVVVSPSVTESVIGGRASGPRRSCRNTANVNVCRHIWFLTLFYSSRPILRICITLSKSRCSGVFQWDGVVLLGWKRCWRELQYASVHLDSRQSALRPSLRSVDIYDDRE